ncbi:MAG: hypothetical protein JO235_15265 [Chroococcidiopsidaceae cyanobacterium CP_BM_RX_35]|nr:hypothetical protein [Chroococcidiopsidaceae cyanobacterium CP_BM_RX_35]
MKKKVQQFASDNYSGMCPTAIELSQGSRRSHLRRTLEYMIKANSHHECAYGEDYWTKQATDLLKDIFETQCEVYFVCKQSGQLASKMRFLSAPWLGLLENNTWLKNSAHEDRMCKIFGGKATGNTGDSDCIS